MAYTWADMVNKKSTTIAQVMTAGAPGNAETLLIGSSTGIPASGYALIDNELIQYSSVGTNEITLAAASARGSGGTTAAGHTSGTVIYFDVIAAVHLNELKNNVAIPPKLITYLNDTVANIPSGWTEVTAARGRYIVGMPASGTLAGTTGTALTDLENRAVGQHNHTATDAGHVHALAYGGGAGGSYAPGMNGESSLSKDTGSGAAVITVANSGSVAGTNAPFIQYVTMQKS